VREEIEMFELRDKVELLDHGRVGVVVATGTVHRDGVPTPVVDVRVPTVGVMTTAVPHVYVRLVGNELYGLALVGPDVPLGEVAE
jgi:hypothetical protein